MRRLTILTLVIFGFAVAGLFARGGAEEPAVPDEEAPVHLTWSSASVPDDAHTQGMFKFKEVVEELSDGQIRVSVHHSAELFTQEAEQAAVRRGTLEMIYTDTPWVADFIPELGLFAAPYVFANYDHMTDVMNGPIGQEVFDLIAAEINVRPLAAFYLGTRHLNLRDVGVEVRRPDDMAGVVLRMPDTPMWQFMGEALGAQPTPMSFPEIYLALQTGTIDAQDNPLPTVRSASFYEVTDYIVLTGHYIAPIMPAINEELWQSLSDRQRDIIMQGVAEAKELVDGLNLEREAELLEFFEEAGLTIIEPDLDAFREYALSLAMEREDISGTWDMDLLDEIQAMVR